MYKKFSITFIVLSALLVTQLGWAQFQPNNNTKDEAAIQRGEKINLPYQTVYFEGTEAVLFDNGPLVTLPGGGCSGGDASILDGTVGGHTLYGWGAQQNLGNYIADDFTSIASWNIDSLKLFTYQTSATTSTITGVYVQIWSGDPTAGGVVVWGDQTTNRLQRTGLSNIYRAQNTTPTDCARRIQEVVATVGTNLPAGTYWVQWGYTGTAASGPWCPPVTIPGVAVTGNAKQYLAGVWSNALNGLTSPNGAPFIVYGSSGAPCPVQPATNPSPADGTTGVDPLSPPANATWTNGANTTQVEVFFGPAGSMASVYSGASITSLAIPPLQYATTYQWKVVCKNDTCSGGPVATWSFTTMDDPNLITLFQDDFEAGTGLWTITNNGGNPIGIWTIFNPPYPNTYTLPASATGGVFAADADNVGSGGNSLTTATVTNPIDASMYLSVQLEFDNDWQAINSADFGYVEVSVDGGTTWTAVRTFDVVDVRNTHELINISSSVASQSFLLRFRSVQPAWDWWWAIDNVKVIAWDVVPVELTSFAATTDNKNVNLNWSTATELNNSGFQIERSNGSEYQVVGFVAGHGTTTDVQNYSYTDQNVKAGSYTYRLKQVDFNGTFEYSDAIEVEVLGIKEFALGQNYPNPFNPSTKINFSLAVDSKVSLKIFDVLGQEVATLINGQLAAGSQEVSFNASSLNSGVYFYRIDADGIDGQKFSSVRKMILTK
ncbi:MAG TPA: T9SS type A sorting domain-containing protein [Ignavibacteriaceae bacterium]|nr:T9SS type A sorting domain-containing protein [Ignavibacteriaceae bacterium]